jgi:acetoin utilization deacetylase AcuC-like enzyme
MNVIDVIQNDYKRFIKETDQRDIPLSEKVSEESYLEYVDLLTKSLIAQKDLILWQCGIGRGHI